MRFELKKGYSLKEVGEWMNHHIGPYEEGVTWFWSAGEVFKEMNQYGQWVEKAKPEGIKIWKDCSATIMAILRWGA